MTLAEAEDFLRAWVRPRAGAIDMDVDALRAALAEMGRRGLLGLRLPAALGGQAFSPLDFRRFQEASARASGALAFLESQHQSACGVLASSPNDALRASLGPLFARGERTSGIAFSHLRRAGDPLVRATPAPGGYALRGRLPWVTGWRLFTDCTTAAALPDGRILFAVHPLAASEALEPSKPLDLAAMSVTQTVSVELRGLVVPEASVVDVRPADWIRANDLIAVAMQSPLILGCAGAAVDFLREAGRPDVADPLDRELEDVRASALAAMAGDVALPEALKARARAIELAGRAAHAAVLAAAGAGNVAPHPAQRIWREALAFSVLALTRPVQEAALRLLSLPRPGS